MIWDIALGIVLAVILLWGLALVLYLLPWILLIGGVLIGLLFLGANHPQPDQGGGSLPFWMKPTPMLQQHINPNGLPAGVQLPPGFSQYEPDPIGKSGSECGHANGPVIDAECGHANGPDEAIALSTYEVQFWSRSMADPELAEPCPVHRCLGLQDPHLCEGCGG